jgi:hypothetical protein
MNKTPQKTQLLTFTLLNLNKDIVKHILKFTIDAIRRRLLKEMSRDAYEIVFKHENLLYFTNIFLPTSSSMYSGPLNALSAFSIRSFYRTIGVVCRTCKAINSLVNELNTEQNVYVTNTMINATYLITSLYGRCNVTTDFGYFGNEPYHCFSVWRHCRDAQCFKSNTFNVSDFTPDMTNYLSIWLFGRIDLLIKKLTKTIREESMCPLDVDVGDYIRAQRYHINGLLFEKTCSREVSRLTYLIIATMTEETISNCKEIYFNKTFLIDMIPQWNLCDFKVTKLVLQNTDKSDWPHERRLDLKNLKYLKDIEVSGYVVQFIEFLPYGVTRYRLKHFKESSSGCLHDHLIEISKCIDMSQLRLELVTLYGGIRVKGTPIHVKELMVEDRTNYDYAEKHDACNLSAEWIYFSSVEGFPSNKFYFDLSRCRCLILEGVYNPFWVAEFIVVNIKKRPIIDHYYKDSTHAHQDNTIRNLIELNGINGIRHSVHIGGFPNQLVFGIPE